MVRKMRATAVELTEYPFRIVNGKGIFIETTIPVASAAAATEIPQSYMEVPVNLPDDGRKIFEAWNPVEETGQKSAK